MKLEQELTLEVLCSYEELDKILIGKGFKVVDEYVMNDDYMIDKSINLFGMDPLEILPKCVLIREFYGIKKLLLYKYKKYDKNGDILEQGKVECPIIDVDKAKRFMEAINYKMLFSIYDKLTVYKKDNMELCVQEVNDKYLFMEYEGNMGKSIEEMKKEIDSLDLPIKKNSYFNKKAVIILKEKVDF